MSDITLVQITQLQSSLDSLFKAMAQADGTTRSALLRQSVTEDIVYWSRGATASSLDELSELFGSFLDDYGAVETQRTGEIQHFRDVGRVAWRLRSLGENNGYQPGEIYFEVNEKGLLREVVVFKDPPHSVPAAGGPMAYVHAWNADAESDRQDILEAAWAPNGRWVELKFDKTGPQAVAETMSNAIHLQPVGGIMDIISVRGKGSQVRFQVDVTRRSGEPIGRFTDFVALDDRGRVKRLAGFRGETLVPARSGGTVDEGWQWSYAAGYLDSAKAYAGGSEIMHLAAHNGKLYAANGYWEDSHWLVPEGEPRQSAQVLRLDSSDGRWEVDLDMGKESPPDLNFMKGNMLKSVTFTKDASGAPLPKPRTLLVMAAGTIHTHVCVWVRDDTTGTWAHQVVAHGPYQKTTRGTPGQKRWVPRAMEIHTDRVTGKERIFLLLGNPGIIAGAYDPDSPTGIRWDTEIEHPTEGYLHVRPLAMTCANGTLYFSAGSSIYQRNDGPEPTYSEVICLSDVSDVEMGGIRGLSTVENPEGEGQSLIFMWIPSHHTPGRIVRLDPDGAGGFTVHDEVETREMINKTLGGDVVKRSVLGAYNNFHPVTDPATGKTVHLFGFQARVEADPSILCHGYYGGGMYGIRSGPGEYSVGIINGPYESGKPVLKGTRSFAVSPFGDGRIFAGGNDSNFIPSTDMAWIFSADIGTWLSPTRA